MGIDYAWLLAHYGYLAVAIGTFFEGETILLADVWAAQQGYIDVRGVVAAAVVGSFAGDQLYFFLGKTFGRAWLVRWPSAARSSRRVFSLLERHQNAFILAFRFLYGLRTVAPFLFGASGVDARRFVPLNFLGAVLWSTTLALGGLAIADVGHRLWQVLPGAHAKVVAISLLVPLFLALWIVRSARQVARLSRPGASPLATRR